MSNEPSWDGIPQFFKDPLPTRRKELKTLRDQLFQRLATSTPHSRDFELVKEKLGSIYQKLEKKWTPKDYVFLAIGILGVAVGVLGFIR
jgi:hypothetical protein